MVLCSAKTKKGREQIMEVMGQTDTKGGSVNQSSAKLAKCQTERTFVGNAIEHKMYQSKNKYTAQ